MCPGNLRMVKLTNFWWYLFSHLLKYRIILCNFLCFWFFFHFFQIRQTLDVVYLDVSNFNLMFSFLHFQTMFGSIKEYDIIISISNMYSFNFDHRQTKICHSIVGSISFLNIYLLFFFRPCVLSVWIDWRIWYFYVATVPARCVVTECQNVPFVGKRSKEEFCCIKIQMWCTLCMYGGG